MFQNRITFILFITILIISCKARVPFLKEDQIVKFDPYKIENIEEYFKQQDECRSKWEYPNLDTSMKLFVIAQGNYRQFGIHSYANIYFGIDEFNDTVAVKDCLYQGGRNFEGQYIIVEPYQWSEMEKDVFYPFIISSNYYFLVCVVKKLYLARIGGYIDKRNRIKKINLPEK